MAELDVVRGRGASGAVWILLVVMAGLAAGGCQRPIRASQPGSGAAEVAQLWTEPPRGRDLFAGIGGTRLAPDPAARYTVIELKRNGFSRGYTVVDSKDREWSVKFPPEAGPEVVTSRLLWGIGYHQPPIYYLASWTADKAVSPNPQLPARLREKDPDLHGLKAGRSWSYYENPFVGTRELNGLLAFHAMIGNSDLKDQQNVIYELREAFDGAKRWYVARDVGQAFGRTGALDPPRGDPDVFERTGFVLGVEGGRVQFDYHGRHAALLKNIAPAHVRWICGELRKLTDDQWYDAFRAGGYEKPTADRFIRKMKQKIADGLAVKG